MPFSYILCLNHPKSFPFQNKAPQNKQSKSRLKSKRGVPRGTTNTAASICTCRGSCPLAQKPDLRSTASGAQSAS